ncbi:hypothetical protein [Chitinophaga flava]|uniref:Uncharacterized protein n=1 Tax=Chitinophaga flava TaxID=2259036 RepID=A0A365Y1E5_9BACT|nr:hypothetical protein [Chitinophaga flava]RBL92427.1 hypothetical protein DF182_07545 [Chitinophaga flava]
MSYLYSYVDLEEKITAAGGEPKALEALWNGDAYDWRLYLNLYIQPQNGPLERHYLGDIMLPPDFWVPEGETSPWLETILAKEWGKMAIQQYGLEFYFPSPDYPEPDCPFWTERQQGIHCTDCGKLIKPSTTDLPKKICYHCAQKRKSKEALQSDEPLYNVAHLVKIVNEKPESLFPGHFNEFKDLFPPLLEDIDTTAWENTDNWTAADIPLAAMLKWKEQHSQDIRDELQPFKTYKHHLDQLEFEGTKYYFDDAEFESYNRLYYVIIGYNIIADALEEGSPFRLYFGRNITYREDVFMHFIRNAGDGPISIAVIMEHYKDMLSPEEITAILQQLVQKGGLLIQDDHISVTQIGSFIP